MTNLSLNEIAVFSPVFVEEANLLSSRFLNKLNKHRNVTVRCKEEHSEHLVVLLNFLSQQHAQICFLYGKASGDEPETINRDIEVGGTLNLARNVSRLSCSFYLNEEVWFGGL